MESGGPNDSAHDIADLPPMNGLMDHLYFSPLAEMHQRPSSEGFMGDRIAIDEAALRAKEKQPGYMSARTVTPKNSSTVTCLSGHLFWARIPLKRVEKLEGNRSQSIVGRPCRRDE